MTCACATSVMTCVCAPRRPSSKHSRRVCPGRRPQLLASVTCHAPARPLLPQARPAGQPRNSSPRATGRSPEGRCASRSRPGRGQRRRMTGSPTQRSSSLERRSVQQTGSRQVRHPAEREGYLDSGATTVTMHCAEHSATTTQPPFVSPPCPPAVVAAHRLFHCCPNAQTNL